MPTPHIIGIVVLESLSVFLGRLDYLEQILKEERKKSVCFFFFLSFFLLFLMCTFDKNMRAVIEMLFAWISRKVGRGDT